MGLYSKYVLPKVTDFCCATKPIRKQREKVVPLCEGIVLEIGAGSGLNFPFYKAQNVKNFMHLIQKRRWSNLHKKIKTILK